MYHISKHPCTFTLWREVPRWAGWKSLPKNGFTKAPPRYLKLTRGVSNIIGDILVKVRGPGVKVRFWTPFGRETTKVKYKVHHPGHIVCKGCLLWPWKGSWFAGQKFRADGN